MLHRFKSIKTKFGTMALLKTLLLLFGLVVMALFGILVLSSPAASYVAAGGLVLGYLIRNQIPLAIEIYPTVVRIGLFIYGITLFLGDRFGISHAMKLLIITATTVVVFNINFWALSHPEVIPDTDELEERV